MPMRNLNRPNRRSQRLIIEKKFFFIKMQLGFQPDPQAVTIWNRSKVPNTHLLPVGTCLFGSFRMLNKHIGEPSDHSSSTLTMASARMNSSLQDVTAFKSQGRLLLTWTRSLSLVTKESSQSRRFRSNCSTSGAIHREIFLRWLSILRGSTTFMRRRCLRMGSNHSWNENSPTGHEQSYTSVAT